MSTEKTAYYTLLNSFSHQRDAVTSTIPSTSSFNIFQVLGIEYKEVLACRFLGFLLDPNSTHGLGTKPIKHFFSTVLQIDPNFNSEDICISLEDVITNNRRVDIVIRIGEFIYPIEVKIKADDQDQQLSDYYDYYFNKFNYCGKCIYYLTPTGWLPSQKSKRDLDDSCIKCISFEIHINKWLEELSNSIPNSVIRDMIRQYEEVIKEMCAKAKRERVIIETLKLENGINSDNKNIVCTLIDVLAANGDTNGVLQKAIQKAYLRTHLSYDKERYSLQDPSEQSGNYARLEVVDNNSGKVVAKICVETNLYLALAEDVKKSGSYHGWHGKENWGYLNPKGNGKPYKLNDCMNCTDERPIEIDDFLNDITIEGE